MVAIPFCSMTERVLVGTHITLAFFCGLLYITQARNPENNIQPC